MAFTINYQWIAVVGWCMCIHIGGYCIFGFCNDPTMIAFEPDCASAIFTFTVSCIVADFPLYPKSFKQPHVALIYIFEVLVSLLITNVALMLCWIPMVRILSNACSVFAAVLVSMDKGLGCSWLPLGKLAPKIESEITHDILCILLAVAFYVSYVYATDSFLLYKMYMRRRYRGTKPGDRIGGCPMRIRPSFDVLSDDVARESDEDTGEPSLPQEPVTRRRRAAMCY